MAEIEKAGEVPLASEYKALQDAFEQLQRKISPGGIVGALYARNLLLFNEVDTIRSKAVNVEKNEELLLAMCKRSPYQVLQFCQFLLEEQYHCGDILQKALQARGVDTSSLIVATLEPTADENRLLEKQLLERLDALQEMMMSRVAEAQPQEEEEVPEKDETYMLEKKILERLDALQEMMMGRAAEPQPQKGGKVSEEDLPLETGDQSELSQPPSKKSELRELEPEEEEDIGSLQSYVGGAEESSMVTELKLQGLPRKKYIKPSLERYDMKAKTRSDVPMDVKTLEERNKALAEKEKAMEEKEKAMEERDAALREKKKIAGTLATMQQVFDEVQSAFIRYGIEVVAWEDVPSAVQKLAHKQGKDPLPDALLQTATGSEIILLQEMVNVLPRNWPELAAHLGCTTPYLDKMYARERSREHSTPVTERHKIPQCLFLSVAVDWGDREEGTGSRPRNWKTVLEVCRRLCAGSDEKRSKLDSFEEKLISGVKW